MATINGTAGNDVLQGTGDADVISGLAGNDVLIGEGGADFLNGGTGADTMIGGLGSDTYVVDDVNDSVTETDSVAGTGGTDQVRTSINYTLGANVENLFAAAANGAAISNGVVLNGNGLANIIGGGNGNDVLFGGNDSTTDTAGASTGAIDTLQGGQGNDTYIISGGNAGGEDVIVETANDPVSGNVGGVDQVIVIASAERTSYTLTTGAVVESIIASDASSTLELNLTGNASTQTIVGNAGANVLSSGASANGGGRDTLIGLGGNDIYNVASGLVRVQEDANGGFDQVNITGLGNADNTNTNAAGTVDGSRDYDFSGSFVERIEADVTGTGFLNITGNSNSQYIGGNDGSNVLIGNGGTDTLAGFDGDDTYVVDSLDDVVLENSGGGNDRVIALGNYALGGTDGDGDPIISNVELLTASGTLLNTRTGQGNGSFDLNALSTATTLNNYLVGDIGTQTIFGSAGNNILDGFRTNGDSSDGAELLGGADTLVGLGGSDTYRVYDQSDVVIEDTNGGFDWVYTSASYDLRANQDTAQNASFTDEDGVTRSFGAADTTNGNYLSYNAASGTGAAAIAAGTSALSQMQIEILSAANQQGTEEGLDLAGNGFGQIIVGNFAANEISDGGLLTQQTNTTMVGRSAGNFAGGQDQLAGLRGNDTYNVTAQSTTVNEDAGNGTDQVNVCYQTSGGTFGLIADAEVEFLTARLAGNGINLLGNRFNQVITGNTGDDAFNGGGGQDTLVGDAGSDVYTIDASNAGNVTIIEYANTDVAASGTGATAIPRTLDRVNTSVSFDLAATNAAYTGPDGAVQAGGVISIEQIVGIGGGDINITGNGNRQLIVGTTGNNMLNGDNDTRVGGANSALAGTDGGDTLQGLAGNDSYRVYTQADVTLEADGQGTDIVFAGGAVNAVNPTVPQTGTPVNNIYSYTLYQNQSIEGLSAANQSSTTGVMLVGNNLAQSAGIIGTNGNDVIWGRGGNDVLTGRGGSDTFGFAEIGAGNSDTITDFAPGDFIALDSATFSSVTSNGSPALDSGEFIVGTQAVDNNDFIIYNQSTGQLFYDADANGSAASAILFAQITPGTALGFNDFITLTGAVPATQTFTAADYGTPMTAA